MVISLLLKGLDGMRGERMENGGNIRRESENQNKIIPVFFMESWVYQAENSFNKKRGNNIEPSHIPPHKILRYRQPSSDKPHSKGFSAAGRCCHRSSRLA